MSTLVKQIFTSWDTLISALTSIGFTITNRQMRWGNAPNDTSCYWALDEVNQTINFRTSTSEDAFLNEIVDFYHFNYAGLVFTELDNAGCLLYLTPLSETISALSDLTFSCTNNYDSQGVVTPDTLVNGLVVCTPAEQDGLWRYSWRDKGTTFKWDIDNTAGYVSKGTELPTVPITSADMLATINKLYLNSGIWSEYIYEQVLGTTQAPCLIFKINGQKFISFKDADDSTNSRCPVFKLPVDRQTINDPTSTEEYSPNKVYHVDDYCIHEGLLWRCVREVSTPTPFDQTNWTVTTVYAEKNR